MPSLSATHETWLIVRTDDNGVVTTMLYGVERTAAEAMASLVAERGHKQTYEAKRACARCRVAPSQPAGSFCADCARIMCATS